MKERIQEILSEVEAFSSNVPEEVEAFRIKFLGRKGLVKDLYADFKNVPNDQKKEIGQLLNNLKTKATEKTSLEDSSSQDHRPSKLK